MFSIVIPLYNKEKQIENTIKSIQNQTFQEFEIVIVNDGSTDNSVEIVKQIADKRIKLINQPNGGVSSARNTAIKNASFEYIAFLDADDEWMEDYLETIFNMINQYPECNIFATNYKIVDSKGKERFPVNTDLAKFSKNFDNQCGVLEDYFDFASRTAPPICTDSITCKKELLIKIDYFPVNIRLGEDLITWAKLNIYSDICYSKKVKAIYNFKAFEELLDNEPLPDEPDIIGYELIKLLKTTKFKKKSLNNYISLWFKMRTTMYIVNFMRKKALVESFKMIYYNSRKIKNYLLLMLCIFPHKLRIYISKKVLKSKGNK